MTTNARGGWKFERTSQRDSSGWRNAAIALGLLLAAAIALIVWQTMRTEKLKRQLENTRQQAFYSLIDGLQSVETNLSKFMVSATPGEGALLLSRISMQAGEAQGSLAQLPLEGEPIQASIKFVNQLSDYARTLTAAAAAGQPYSEMDLQQLEALLAHCSVINNQLRDMLASVPDSYWSAANANEQAPLVRAMDTENASEYPSLIYDGPFSDGKHEGQAKALGIEQVDADEALRRAVAFIGAERVQAAARTADTSGPVASYGFVVDTTDGRLNVHVTQQGGEILWIIPEQGQYEQILMIPDCVERALAFLTAHGYGEMESSYFQQYEGLAVINFACVERGVLLYPDLVKVQVRMDTGAIVGLEANNYLMNHTERALIDPQLNVEQAREMVSDRLTVSNERLCVIPLTGGEKLAWEFIGKWSDSEFLIYIDANTGKELQILKIIDAENGQLTV
ncbi:MAG: germination protein YpeB [Oscillospiraceae bacterium]|jgi:germination protein YpeB|nr:germination protein YpeB [Oscillospiraceae bacterium]